MHSLTLAVYVLVVVQGCVRDSESNWDFSYIIDKALYIYIFLFYLFYLFLFIFFSGVRRFVYFQCCNLTR